MEKRSWPPSFELFGNAKPGEDPAKDLELAEKIGSGSFGVVYKGCVSLSLVRYNPDFLRIPVGW
jgi:hypothetical protein